MWEGSSSRSTTVPWCRCLARNRAVASDLEFESWRPISIGLCTAEKVVQFNVLKWCDELVALHARSVSTEDGSHRAQTIVVSVIAHGRACAQLRFCPGESGDALPNPNSLLEYFGARCCIDYDVANALVSGIVVAFGDGAFCVCSEGTTLGTGELLHPVLDATMS